MESPRSAVKAGSAVPENGEGAAGRVARAFWDQASSNGPDSRVHDQDSQGSDRKRVATAIARAALIGATLVESVDDAGRREWILSRWAYTRGFDDLKELECVLDRMGAPS